MNDVASTVRPGRGRARGQNGPVRMCLSCRRRLGKYELTRFVLNEQSVPVEDPDQILPGRGYYRCMDQTCLSKWQKRFQQRERGF